MAIAARNLAADIRKVCGAEAVVGTDEHAGILIGTLGHSAAIDRLVKRRLLDGGLLRGRREKYIITLVGRQLVIAGSDRRGTIYGIYELSRQMGVSPWYDWADVPVARHRFYACVFELILRLKGNMLWPAMWGWAFYADDPENSRTADEMGVIMGTSHHEPMARNHQEWARRRKDYGAWNYQTNQTVLDRFFREGIERMKGTEDIVTIGMRGDGDEAMSEEADTRLMQRIVENQRRIIADVTRRPAKETPQVWALYKEVLDYYDKGMRVPDDVTMLLCDDNWGNVRRVPAAKERNRAGGWGLYYHVDYVGAPRNSKWLNVTPTQNMWEQLQLAYNYGIDRLWILNVGDLKQYLSLRPEQRDAYRELVLFPLQAMSNVYQMYYAQAMNHFLYERNNPDANLWADRVAEAFRRDSLLCAAYNHDIAGGKWNGMMTQKHIGYTSWNDDFPRDKMPEVHRVETDGRPGGFVFEARDSVVAMEAEHFFACLPSSGARWTVIPYMGRTRSGLTLMPNTAPVAGASLSYRFSLGALRPSEVNVRVMVKSTLDFLNRGGLRYTVSLDGGQEREVNFNARLNERKENIYTVYYPTVARRVVESVVTLPVPPSPDGYHTLTIRPLDSAIVFEKVLVDAGGYKPGYLMMEESPCRR